MAQTAANVRVAVTGGVYRADSDTPSLPNDAIAALTGYTEQGYVTEDGITQTIDSDTEDIRAWQNGDTVRVVQTSHALTYALSLMETTGTTLETFYGNFDDLGGGEGVTEVRASQGVRGAWVLHVIDGDHLIRIVIPDGEVTERGDVEYVNGNAISYPITISCYPDDTGTKAYIYLAEVAGS